MSAVSSTLWRDLALFTATAAAFVGHLQQRQTQQQQHPRLPGNDCDIRRAASANDPTPINVHASIQAMMPSMAMSHSSAPIIGLLFAASWCPDCWQVVPKVGKVAEYAQSDDQPNCLVDIVYVSSDASEADILKFKSASLKHIPFEARQERADLKRTFQTCAAKEMHDLGMTATRLHGIPTLILLETATGRTLTVNGVDDVMQRNTDSFEQVLKKWKDLLNA
jgi:Thioredoxin-like